MAKPSASATLDTGNSLYANMLYIWPFLEGSGATAADYKDGNDASLLIGSWQTVAAGPIWQNHTVIVSPTLPIISVTPFVLGNTNINWSVAWGVDQLHDDDNGMICGDITDANSYIWQSGGNFLRLNDGAVSNFTGVTSFTGYHDYLMTGDFLLGVHNDIHLYVDGTEVSGSPISNQIGNLTINSLASGFSGSLNFTGDFYYLYVWNARVLDGTDAATLHSDPYSIFVSGGGPTFVSKLASLGVG